MDIHEVFKFVNLFPFLVDRDELNQMIETEKAESAKYALNEDSQMFPFEESSSSEDESPSNRLQHQF